MLNDTSVASAGFYIRTCRRIRNSKKIATIRDFHQNICVNPTIVLTWELASQGKQQVLVKAKGYVYVFEQLLGLWLDLLLVK